MPFVTPKGASTTSNSGAGGRTTFRPPWVKDDAATSTKTNTTVPWAKKLAEKEKDKEKENGDKSTAKKPTATATSKAAADTNKITKQSDLKKTTTEPAKKTTAEPAKKVAEPVKRFTTPAKKTAEPAATPAKKPLGANAKTTPAARTTAAKKKEPTPPSSSSEEETEESESEESDDEINEDEIDADDFSFSDISEPVNQPFKDGPILKPVPKQPTKEKESESQRRFSIEKPKLRPVLRDKSMKKVEDEEEANDDESEEDRERRLRFKLEKPKLRHVKREEKPLPSKSTENILKMRPTLKKVPKVDELLKEPKEEPKPEFKTKTLRKAPSINRDPSTKNVPAPPPLPSLVPKAPPPPPPPLGAPGDKKSLSHTQKAVLDKLRSRPRRRPDWSEMMKEVESGRKLRHVQCNDRSQPILTCKSMTKVDNKFIYETEKDNSHNKLLKQIQFGIKLKPTKTNDRSKPFIDGLRKFRRQMTIEEQLQKSQSKINMLSEAPTIKEGATPTGRPSLVPTLSAEESSADELDDIDKIRDDLQSTKQMLALELRNREAQERENKKLLQKIATLEAELEREKSREKNLEYGSNVIIATMDAQPHSEQLYLKSLKEEAEGARKTAKELEKKYLDTGESLDQAKIEIEEQKRQIQMLERKLAQALQGDMTPNASKKFNFCYAYEDDDDDDFDTFFGGVNGTALNNHNNHKGGGSLNGSRRTSDANAGRDSSSDLDVELSESDPDEPEEKKTERRERRLGKEVKVLRNKLTKVKVKQEAAKKEKQALKQAMKKNHVILKEENKKFKKLEKEVQKMAASMKEEEEDDAEEKDEDEEEEEAAEEEEEEEESEESEESESEESEAETESESEAEDATNTAKKSNLEPRVKKHEGRFNAMKKCNVLLQANVDNLQEEITQVRAKAANLQSELDAVLADLGF